LVTGEREALKYRRLCPAEHTEYGGGDMRGSLKNPFLRYIALMDTEFIDQNFTGKGTYTAEAHYTNENND
jgi:hypothetical protein